MVMEREQQDLAETDITNRRAQVALGLMRNKWTLCLRELGFMSPDDPTAPSSVELITPGGITLTLNRPVHSPFHSDAAHRSDLEDINAVLVSYVAGDTAYALRVSNNIEPYVVASEAEHFVLPTVSASELVQAVMEGELITQSVQEPMAEPRRA